MIAGSTYAALARRIMLTAVAVGMTGCSSARRDEPLTGPMTLGDASVQRGKLLYDAHCYQCHAGGEGGMAPAINNKPLPRSLIRFQVRHGLGTMPSFPESKLSDRDVDDIANYLVALRQHGR